MKTVLMCLLALSSSASWALTSIDFKKNNEAATVILSSKSGANDLDAFALYNSLKVTEDYNSDKSTSKKLDLVEGLVAIDCLLSEAKSEAQCKILFYKDKQDSNMNISEEQIFAFYQKFGTKPLLRMFYLNEGQAFNFQSNDKKFRIRLDEDQLQIGFQGK